MVKVKEDMTGWIMSEHGVPDSKLTVIKQVEDYIFKNGERKAQWLCECDCTKHTKIIVFGQNLRRGQTKSCGCIQSQRTIESNHKLFHKINLYDLNITDTYGEYGIGYCFNTGRKFYFDMEDYDKIKDYCWHENIDKRNQYSSLKANSIDEFGKRTIITMHHVIIGKYYDHIDRNTFNNRKYNLRKASFSENARNKSVQKNNSSGFTGVSFDKKSDKWRAYIRIDGAQKTLGFYKDKEDAIKTRLEYEAKYYGEFAPQRHLFEQYKINVSGGDSDG